MHGGLAFAAERAPAHAGRCNLPIAPCVSPWAHERVQRWNVDAPDPNRSFKSKGKIEESGALTALVRAPDVSRWKFRSDLCEPTDPDGSEFIPTKAAAAGETVYGPDEVPDGFCLVVDAAKVQLPLQETVRDAVRKMIPHCSCRRAFSHHWVPRSC